jgi:hypothetical protein
MVEWSAQLWPSIKEGWKPEPAFIHLFVADTCSNEHPRRHIKRPAATFDRPATLHGVEQALHQSRQRHSQHPVRLFSSQQRVTTATSRYPRTSTAGSIHHERSACHRAHRHKPLHSDSSHQDKLWHTCQNCTYDWRPNKYIYVGTVAIISQYRMVPITFTFI